MAQPLEKNVAGSRLDGGLLGRYLKSLVYSQLVLMVDSSYFLPWILSSFLPPFLDSVIFYLSSIESLGFRV